MLLCLYRLILNYFVYMGEKTSQKRPVWHYVAGVIAFLFVVGLLGELAGSPTKNSSNIPTSSAEETISDKQEDESEWVRVTGFLGNSDKNTETFTITGEMWRISWSHTTENAYFGFTPVKVDGTRLEDCGITALGTTDDSTICYENGEFYLDIDASYSYGISVEEYK